METKNIGLRGIEVTDTKISNMIKEKDERTYFKLHISKKTYDKKTISKYPKINGNPIVPISQTKELENN